MHELLTRNTDHAIYLIELVLYSTKKSIGVNHTTILTLTADYALQHIDAGQSSEKVNQKTCIENLGELRGTRFFSLCSQITKVVITSVSTLTKPPNYVHSLHINCTFPFEQQ